ncbi:hypothetical protein GCK72_021428 [Caenorhabditis remanei]|uniref:F-box domain-containing protein n=1 Tax=Caenorhabditis remanei TaxID=31234 RepID=A0A6A5GJJ0_CAERE|nr:hypothetical protein GCK72_021428 [Caenorhabditis remanei]KAF1754863.1 hypothetical protein GCK72_021428 [Caenorhabditis remanei]
MSLFKLFSCCLPVQKSKKNPVLDSPVGAVSPVVVSPTTPKIQDVFLLDMPDLVMREILKNLDVLTFQKLRKVCFSLRKFVDFVKPDSNLKEILIEVRADLITGSVKGQQMKMIKHVYKEHEDGCEMTINFREAKVIEKNFIDVYAGNFLRPLLENQKSPLDKLCLIEQNADKLNMKLPQTPRKFLVPTFENVFNCSMKVLESRGCLLQVECLKISVLGQDQLMTMLRYVDLKFLKKLKIYRLEETESRVHTEYILNLDILENCEKLEKLCVKGFYISSSFSLFTHIPELKVSMQIIYCDEVIQFQETLVKFFSVMYATTNFPTNLDLWKLSAHHKMLTMLT